ncbi:unnamed protein product [Brachionus calyciflorus]|uniref:Uncharacterized protein n=1 Tax=Brachionus calyciflorus TaxID=104777 RepID=A0A813XBJ0_9BILA|nr:unnamed protein product [Brachionus calyciflorus]
MQRTKSKSFDDINFAISVIGTTLFFLLTLFPTTLLVIVQLYYQYGSLSNISPNTLAFLGIVEVTDF